MSTTMGIPPIEYEQWDQYGATPEKQFRAKANLKEGISGCAPMDTTFENTIREQVKAPRSDEVNRPMPRDYFGDLSRNQEAWERNEMPPCRDDEDEENEYAEPTQREE